MKKPLSPYLTEDRPSENAGTQPSGEEAPAGHSNHAVTFTCDTCEQIIAIDEAVMSPVLPCSRFCSTGCRDEAELAAENAKYL